MTADVVELLEAASLLVPAELATGNDLTVDDVWEHLAHDEWEVALGVLEGLGDIRRPALDAGFWEALAAAAEQLHLERSAAWCHWRCSEARHGVIRADLTLAPASESRRQTAFSGAGVLRPMWDIGHRSPTGVPALDIAWLWVESTPFLGPGERSSVRLAPLDPAQWRHLEPGQVITMHEGRDAGGTAVVLELRPPVPPPGTSA
ncbi:hypothetical protein [Kitasatospora sp. LaBMicrA B282]|uniref:hypothetical protein n=1 Tax=Kitasatospora sp. LaBMicrA B282 TaxID=3420949 RepID=UPI003D116560